MHPLGPQPSDDVGAAAWIGPRLIPGFGALVGRMVPTGYERYARILHAADDDEGNPVRWAEVARTTGRAVHPLVQWHRLVGIEDSYGAGGLWPGNPPRTGELDPAELAALVDVLGRHTPPGDCWFCWDQRESVDGGLGTLARVELVHGRYLLARGPLGTAPLVGLTRGSGNRFCPEAPAIWWPDDRTWCVGSDQDIDSTVVGGTAALIADVLADPRLEALPVEPDDSLMSDADLVN